MKGNCGECERRYTCEIDPDKCNEWPDPAPKTNADRIRAMSDEELADFLTKENWICDKYEVCKKCPRYIADCCLPIDEWLQAPAGEE